MKPELSFHYYCYFASYFRSMYRRIYGSFERINISWSNSPVFFVYILWASSFFLDSIGEKNMQNIYITKSSIIHTSFDLFYYSVYIGIYFTNYYFIRYVEIWRNIYRALRNNMFALSVKKYIFPQECHVWRIALTNDILHIWCRKST